MAMNRIATNRIAINRIATNIIATNRIAINVRHKMCPSPEATFNFTRRPQY